MNESSKSYGAIPAFILPPLLLIFVPVMFLGVGDLLEGFMAQGTWQTVVTVLAIAIVGIGSGFGGVKIYYYFTYIRPAKKRSKS